MKQNTYIVKCEHLKDWHDKAEKIYSNMSLIELFYKSRYEIDDWYKIKFILQDVVKQSDLLYADLIETLYSDE